MALSRRMLIPSSTRADVWEKCDGRCHYCGVDLHPFRTFTIDHVVPFVRGGTNDLDNLVGSCQRCNSSKNDDDLDGFLLRREQPKQPRRPKARIPSTVITSTVKLLTTTQTVSQAAARLGVHPTTLRTWADKGMVAMVKLPSGYRRFEPSEIERVRSNMRGGGDAGATGQQTH